jgi:hypothetical protein
MIDPAGYTVDERTDATDKRARYEALCKRLGIQSAEELRDKILPPTRYALPGIIAEGLTLLAGMSKIGKSFMALGIGLSIARGDKAFGSIPVELGDVLYLALEDGEKRVQRRIRQMIQNPKAEWPSRFRIAYRWRPMNSGGLADLSEWIAEAANPRLIMIDVLQKIRSEQKRSEGAYAYDYRSLEDLQKLAVKTSMPILAATHVNKGEHSDQFNSVSGTVGLTGAADNVLVLRRVQQGGTTLYGRGRDIEDFEHAVQFDKHTGAWTILGDASEIFRSDERANILFALEKAAGPMGPADIAKATQMKPNAVSALLTKMVGDGQVEKVGTGLYRSARPSAHWSN